MAQNICIYHENCADGFGAAWAVRRYASSINNLSDWEFMPATYGSARPDVTGKDVFLVDFSYKRATLEAMAHEAKSVTVLDHHKTSEDDLRPLLDNGMIGGVFDKNRSGAVIAWQAFFLRDVPMPQLLAHIQDRDLWKFELPRTKEIMAAVFTYPYDFEVWDKLMTLDLDKLAEVGAAILQGHDKNVLDMLKITMHDMFICGYRVKAANLPPIFASDAGHIMGQGQPFAATYYESSKGELVFSLRSDENGVDVAALAESFGGGGHKHAAGFKVHPNQVGGLSIGMTLYKRLGGD